MGNNTISRREYENVLNRLARVEALLTPTRVDRLAERLGKSQGEIVDAARAIGIPLENSRAGAGRGNRLEVSPADSARIQFYLQNATALSGLRRHLSFLRSRPTSTGNRSRERGTGQGEF